MKWKIRYSKQAMKFLSKNPVLNLDVYIIKAIKRVFFQEDTNIDVKKMKGGWKGYYRIKEGDLRIILDFKKDEGKMKLLLMSIVLVGEEIFTNRILW